MDYGSTIHQVGTGPRAGRFIVATWSERHGQWQSSNRKGIPASDRESYRYTFSRKLEGLAGAGIRTYARQSDARRAARRLYGGEE